MSFFLDLFKTSHALNICSRTGNENAAPDKRGNMKSVRMRAGYFLRTVLCFVTLTFSTGLAFGATYYIDFNNGRDSNAGTSIESPWKTIPGTRNAQMSGWQSSCWGNGCPGTPTVSLNNRVPAGTVFKLKSGSTHDSTNGSVIWIRRDSSGIYASDATAADPILFQRDTTWGSGAVTFDGSGMGLTAANAEAIILVITDGIKFDGVTSRGITIQNSGVNGLRVKDQGWDDTKDFALNYVYLYNNGTSIADYEAGAGVAGVHVRQANGVAITNCEALGNSQKINGFLFGEYSQASTATTVTNWSATGFLGGAGK